MCMIIYKPVGIELPGLDIFKAAARNNPHGIGMMFPNMDKVCIYKQKMSPEDAYTMLNGLDVENDNWKTKPLVVHFRMATHGTVSDENCHPFPITNDDTKLGARYCTADIGLAHNGVIYMSPKTGTESDTYGFVKQYLADFTWDTFSKTYKLLDEEILKTDRLIVMNGAGDIIKWGEWTEYKGCLYSTHMSDSVLKNIESFGYLCRGRYGYGYGGSYVYEDDYWTAEDYKKDAEEAAVFNTMKFGKRPHKMVCDICLKATGNTWYIRDGVSLCQSCYEQFFLTGNMKAKVQELHSYEHECTDGYMDQDILDMVEVTSAIPVDGVVTCDYCNEEVMIDNALVMEIAGFDDQVAVCSSCYNTNELRITDLCGDRDVYRMAVGNNMKLMR